MANDNLNQSETAEAHLDLDPKDEAVADSVLAQESEAISDSNKEEGEFKRTGRMTLYVRRFMRRPSAVFGLVLLLVLRFLLAYGALSECFLPRALVVCCRVFVWLVRGGFCSLTVFSVSVFRHTL